MALDPLEGPSRILSFTTRVPRNREESLTEEEEEEELLIGLVVEENKLAQGAVHDEMEAMAAS